MHLVSITRFGIGLSAGLSPVDPAPAWCERL